LVVAPIAIGGTARRSAFESGKTNFMVSYRARSWMGKRSCRGEVTSSAARTMHQGTTTGFASEPLPKRERFFERPNLRKAKERENGCASYQGTAATSHKAMRRGYKSTHHVLLTEDHGGFDRELTFLTLGGSIDRWLEACLLFMSSHPARLIGENCLGFSSPRGRQTRTILHDWRTYPSTRTRSRGTIASALSVRARAVGGTARLR
jgi:hypothetical protein